MKISLMVTRACNLRCKYCYFRDSDYESRRMEFETAKKIVDKCGAYCKENERELLIHFFGGEPFLNFNLIRKIIEYSNTNLNGIKINYTVTTNGTLFNKEIAEFLKKNKVNIRLSFDGCIETHDSQRVMPDGKGSSEFILKNLHLFKNYPGISVTMTISQSEASKLKKGVLELWEKGMKNVKVQYSMDEFWEKANIAIFREQMISLSEAYLKLKNSGKDIHLTKIDKFTNSETCLYNLMHNLFFEYDGSCVLCGCAPIGNKKRVWEVGHINDENFLEKLAFIKFDSENIEYFRKKVVKNTKILALLKTPGLMFCDIISRKGSHSLKDYVKNRIEMRGIFEEAYNHYLALKK